MSEDKVWVEKMPEVCKECPYIEKFDGQCKLSGRIMTYNQMHRKVKKICPLHSIKDHDRELVSQVCEKIEDWCNKNFNWVGDGIGYDGQDYNEMIGSNNTINKLKGFLNQIQKEFEDVRE